MTSLAWALAMLGVIALLLWQHRDQGPPMEDS